MIIVYVLVGRRRFPVSFSALHFPFHFSFSLNVIFLFWPTTRCAATAATAAKVSTRSYVASLATSPSLQHQYHLVNTSATTATMPSPPPPPIHHVYIARLASSPTLTPPSPPPPPPQLFTATATTTTMSTLQESLPRDLVKTNATLPSHRHHHHNFFTATATMSILPDSLPRHHHLQPHHLTTATATTSTITPSLPPPRSPAAESHCFRRDVCV